MMVQRRQIAQLGWVAPFLGISFSVQAADLTGEEIARYRELEDKPLFALSNIEFADYLDLRRRLLSGESGEPSPSENAGFFAVRSTGTPFRLNALRFSLSEADCVVVVERALAMGLAQDWRSYYLISERLRHKDGVVGYRNRNFHTLGDWLPANKWLLNDVTGDLGPVGAPVARAFTHVVRPKVFEEFPAAPGSAYVRTVYKGSDYRSPDAQVVHDVYVPGDRVPEILRDLQTGDVVLVLRDSAGGHLGCDHLGLIVREGDRVYMAHAAPPRAQRMELSGFLKHFPWVRGFKFLRLRADATALVAAECEKMANLTVPTPSEQDRRSNALLAQRARGSDASK